MEKAVKGKLELIDYVCDECNIGIMELDPYPQFVREVS